MQLTKYFIKSALLALLVTLTPILSNSLSASNPPLPDWGEVTDEFDAYDSPDGQDNEKKDSGTECEECKDDPDDTDDDQNCFSLSIPFGRYPFNNSIATPNIFFHFDNEKSHPESSYNLQYSTPLNNAEISYIPQSYFTSDIFYNEPIDYRSNKHFVMSDGDDENVVIAKISLKRPNGAHLTYAFFADFHSHDTSKDLTRSNEKYPPFTIKSTIYNISSRGIPCGTNSQLKSTLIALDENNNPVPILVHYDDIDSQPVSNAPHDQMTIDTYCEWQKYTDLNGKEHHYFHEIVQPYLTLNKDVKYFVRQLGDGSKIKYQFDYDDENREYKTTPISVTYPNGAKFTLDTFKIKIIRNSANSLRQIYSAFDGLADIVGNTAINGYEINLYSPEDVIEPQNPNDAYTVKPNAVPYKSWHISKIVNSDSSHFYRVARFENGNEIKHDDWTYSETINQWTKILPDTLRKTSKSIVKFDGDSQNYLGFKTTGYHSVIDRITKDDNDNIFRRTLTFQKLFPKSGLKKALVIQDPEGLKLITKYKYDNSGRLLSTTFPDGSSVSFEYDDDNRKISESRQFMDNDERKTSYSYSSAFGMTTELASKTVQIQGKTVSKTFYEYSKSNSGEYIKTVKKALTPNATSNTNNNIKTKTTYYPPSAGIHLAGNIKRIIYPNGIVDEYSYETGSITPDTNSPITNFYFSPYPNGLCMKKTVTHTVTNMKIPFKTTMDVTYLDRHGDPIVSETHVWDGSAFTLIKWTHRKFKNHRLCCTTNSNNTSTTINRNSSGLITNEKKTDGTMYGYNYNPLRQLIRKSKEYGPTILYTRNPFGQITNTTTTAGNLTLSTTTQYDAVGRITSYTDESGLTTTYSYTAIDDDGEEYDTGGRITTVTHPGGATTITENYKCGKVKSITGSAVVPEFYEYAVNHNFSNDENWVTCTTVHKDSPNSPRFTKTYYDMLGRVVKTESPAFNGNTIVSKNFYNSFGQLVKTTKTARADTLYEYDQLGNLTRTGLDIDGNDSLDPASSDRITDYDSRYSFENNAWFKISTVKTYPETNSSDSITLSVSKIQLTNLDSANGVVARTINIDQLGNTSYYWTTVNQNKKTRTENIKTPQSIYNSTRKYVNGLLLSERTPQLITYSYSYDPLGRLISQTDPRTGTTTTEYYTDGKGSIGKIKSITDPAGHTTYYFYDESTGMKNKIVNPLGNETIYSYNTRGQITSITGSAQYPTAYSYNQYGEMTELLTWRNKNSNPDNPFPTADADSTTWQYNEPTGLLTTKIDAKGKQVSYTYNSANRLATRTWARGITTNYNYDPKTGELILIDYDSDNTVDISYSYSRTGQLLAVSDASGTRIFDYDDSGLLTNENINVTLNSGNTIFEKNIRRNYMDSHDYKNKYCGYTILDANTTTILTNKCLIFDNRGRVNKIISSPGSNSNYQFSPLYQYNSNLIREIKNLNNGYRQLFKYDPHTDVIQAVKIKNNSGTLLSKYKNFYDALYRRQYTLLRGSLVERPLDRIKYLYNSRSELTTAVSDSSYYPYNDHYNFSFNYDNIGNRIKATGSSDSSVFSESSYTTNELNQYTGISSTGVPLWSPSYDDDGNCLNAQLQAQGYTSAWSFTFNAENRIIAAENSNYRLEFDYDYMGRRIYKKIYTKASDGSLSFKKQLFYLYDGYKQIMRIRMKGSPANPKLAITRRYAWFGERLLMTYHGTEQTPYFAFSDSNKNITDYLDINGNSAAHFEYSPFGKTTVATGTITNNKGENIVNRFVFRFSSEYQDTESGLVYYNFRYYSPELGRWLSRDPIGESGGYNLYAMVGNSPVNWWDDKGHNIIKKCVDIYSTATGQPIPTDFTPKGLTEFGIGLIVDIPSTSVMGNFLKPTSFADQDIPIFEKYIKYKLFNGYHITFMEKISSNLIENENIKKLVNKNCSSTSPIKKIFSLLKIDKNSFLNLKTLPKVIIKDYPLYPPDNFSPKKQIYTPIGYAIMDKFQISFKCAKCCMKKKKIIKKWKIKNIKKLSSNTVGIVEAIYKLNGIKTNFREKR